MNVQLLENEFLTCEIDPDLPVMIHRWKRSPSSVEFRNQLRALQQVYINNVKQYPGLMWLADTMDLGERSAEDEEWLEVKWEELLFVEAGVKVHAVILGDDIYADYSMEKFKSQAKTKFAEVGVRLGVFMDESSAYQWMRQQTN